MNDNTDSPTIQTPLLHGHVLILDEVDDGLLRFNWTPARTSDSRTFYAQRTLIVEGKRTCQQIHRMIMADVLDRPLERYEHVDHRNHNGLDNRRSNLRMATLTQNMGNRQLNSDNTSGYKGVSYCKNTGKWLVQLTVNGRSKKLGRFKTPEIAARIYNDAALKYFGEFAWLNILPDEIIKD